MSSRYFKLQIRNRAGAWVQLTVWKLKVSFITLFLPGSSPPPLFRTHPAGSVFQLQVYAEGEENMRDSLRGYKERCLNPNNNTQTYVIRHVEL